MLFWSAEGGFDVFKGTYAIDNFGTVFKILIIVSAVVSLLLLLYYLKNNSHIAHAPIALLFTTLGAMGVSSSVDLGLIILFLQMMSLGLYMLVGIIRRDKISNEATLKYFIFAASALAIMAFGLTFLFGLTGSLDIRVIGAFLIKEESVWILIALSMIFIGYGFEITIVPFHFWAPDVYEGSTAPVAGLISTLPKVAGFAGLLRMLLSSYQGNFVDWSLIIAILSAVTMTFGNLVALRQTKLKRLLAYSSIAQSGYILMGAAAAVDIETALPSIGFYLIAYIFMNLSAFAVISLIERNFGTDDKIIFRGLNRLNPFAAAVLAVSMLSLAGIPPLAGFAGKVFILNSVLDKGYVWLLIIGIINMVMGLYYYISIAAEIYLKPPIITIKPKTNAYYLAASIICFGGTILFGIFPSLGLSLTNLLNNYLK
jgi:NADH-quinone oxidoreductase subunit N